MAPISSRLLSLLLITVVLVYIRPTASRRYGAPARTLHFKEVADDSMLELDADAVPTTGFVKDAVVDAEAAGSESRQRRAAGREPPKVTMAKLNTTQHKVVVHWAGEGSQVIVALAASILPSR